MKTFELTRLGWVLIGGMVVVVVVVVVIIAVVRGVVVDALSEVNVGPL